jgi:hypothetical protein
MATRFLSSRLGDAGTRGSPELDQSGHFTIE